MTNIICYLDSVKKWRNQQEWRTVPRITCPEFDLEIVGDGLIVKQMMSLLAEKEVDSSRLFEVRRGTTLVFTLHPLELWLNPPDRRPEHLKRQKESPLEQVKEAH